ncbi:MAG: hypothetical protein ABII89_06610 [Candidatus Omnitrophota bacterium]
MFDGDQKIVAQYNFYFLKEWDSSVRILGLKAGKEKVGRLLKEFQDRTGSKNISQFKQWLKKKDYEVLEISLSLDVLIESAKREAKYDQVIKQCQPEGSDSWN